MLQTSSKFHQNSRISFIFWSTLYFHTYHQIFQKRSGARKYLTLAFQWAHGHAGPSLLAEMARIPGNPFFRPLKASQPLPMEEFFFLKVVSDPWHRDLSRHTKTSPEENGSDFEKSISKRIPLNIWEIQEVKTKTCNKNLKCYFILFIAHGVYVLVKVNGS